MPKNWFIHISGENVGPLATNLVVRMLQQNRLQFVDYIWTEGFENWARISEVEDFAEHMPPFPSVEFPQPEPEPEPEPEPVEEIQEIVEIEASEEVVVEASPEEEDQEITEVIEATEEEYAAEEEVVEEPEPPPPPKPAPKKPAPTLRAVPGGKAPVPAAKPAARAATVPISKAGGAAPRPAPAKPMAKPAPKPVAVATKPAPAAKPVAKPVAPAKPAAKPAVAAKPAAKPAPKAPAKRQWRVPIDARVSIDDHGEFAVLDISEGGLMVEASAEIAIGSDLRIHIESPSFPKALDMTALLVRQDTFEGKRSYGIEFTKVNPAHRRTLAAYVKSKLSIDE